MKESEAFAVETAYYTLTAREVAVSGEAVANASGAPARQLVCVRKPIQREEARQDNVIDLFVWKAAREEEQRLEEEWYEGVDQRLEGPAVVVPRPRRDHGRTVLIGGELLATLSVIGAMALLMIRILCG